MALVFVLLTVADSWQTLSIGIYALIGIIVLVCLATMCQSRLRDHAPRRTFARRRAAADVEESMRDGDDSEPHTHAEQTQPRSVPSFGVARPRTAGFSDIVSQDDLTAQGSDDDETSRRPPPAKVKKATGRYVPSALVAAPTSRLDVPKLALDLVRPSAPSAPEPSVQASRPQRNRGRNNDDDDDDDVSVVSDSDVSERPPVRKTANTKKPASRPLQTLRTFQADDSPRDGFVSARDMSADESSEDTFDARGNIQPRQARPTPPGAEVRRAPNANPTNVRAQQHRQNMNI